MVKTNVPLPSALGKKRGQIEIRVPPVIGIFEHLMDWRKARGKVYQMGSLLMVVLAGLMCGKQKMKPLSRWCAELPFLDRARLGLPLGRSPGATTLGRLLAKLDPGALETAIRHWLTAVNKQLGRAGLALRIAIDGKTLRGAAKRGANPVHLLAAVCHQLKIVLAQVAVDSKTNEITAVIPLLKLLVLEGRLVTMDALLTQREVAQEILARKGDYLMVVKENQPQLFQDIAICFASEPLVDEVRRTAQTVNKGHGRLEVREIVTSAALKGFVDWPGAEQVMQITRTVTKVKTGETTTKSVYAITSLPPSRGSPELLLEANRGHWTIENGIHWVRDVTLGEDNCAVHKDRAPQILAALRNVVIALLRLHGHKNIAAAIDRYSARPQQAMLTMGLTTGL
jgi:predicted transposase YbfD/YdcC